MVERAAAADTDIRELDFTWEMRLANRLRVPLLLLALLVALFFAATYFVPGFLLGFVPVQFSEMESDFPIDPFTWAAIITSLLGGFTAVSLPYVSRRRMSDISELAPVVPSLDKRGLQRLYVDNASDAPRVRLAVTLTGWLVGFAIPYYSTPGAAEILTFRVGEAEPSHPPEVYLSAAWFVVVVPVLIASLAKATFIMVHGARQTFAALGRLVDVDPLEADALRPLANAGLRTAFMLLIGVAIGTLFLLNSDIDPEAILGFMIFIAALAALSAVSPALVGARLIRKAKQAVLGPLRAAITRARDKAVEGDDAAQARLGALIAYEHRLMEARELPIDTPAVGQFALYLTIPVISWLGGAFVERMVDAALG